MSQTVAPTKSTQPSSAVTGQKRWNKFKSAFEGYLYLSLAMIVLGLFTLPVRLFWMGALAASQPSTVS